MTSEIQMKTLLIALLTIVLLMTGCSTLFPSPAKFIVGTIQVPAEADMSQPVRVEVSVSNAGGSRGSQEFILEAIGNPRQDEEYSQTITLEPSENGTLIFNIPFKTVGQKCIKLWSDNSSIGQSEPLSVAWMKVYRIKHYSLRLNDVGPYPVFSVPVIPFYVTKVANGKGFRCAIDDGEQEIYPVPSVYEVTGKTVGIHVLDSEMIDSGIKPGWYPSGTIEHLNSPYEIEYSYFEGTPPTYDYGTVTEVQGYGKIWEEPTK
jgi:hypothetical protein